VPNSAGNDPWDFLGDSRASRSPFGGDDDEPGSPEGTAYAPFSSGRSEDGAGSVVSTPYGWILAAAGCAILSIAIGLMAQDRPRLAVLGWLIGGACSIGLLTVFTIRDGRLRAGSWYSRLPWADRLRPVVILAAAVGVGLNAWWFADTVSRTVGS
jgi:hypothetical protein